jgi:hypothetical protein
MKFTVYEVTRVRREEKDDYEDSFLYAEYYDAVAKFNELVEKEKQVDWIEECIEMGVNNDEGREIDIMETVDYWGIYVEDFFTRWSSEVTITEREVF